MIGQNTKFKFRATFVEADGTYLKVWIQIDNFLCQTINEKTREFASYLDQSINNYRRNPNIATPNGMCFVRSPSGQYQRARIQEIRPDGMKVHLMDYGPVILANFHNICFLDNSSQAIYLQALPAAVDEFIIANIVPPCNNSWPEETVRQIHVTLTGKEFYGYYQNSNGHKLLRFEFCPGGDFAEMLVSRNLALFR